MAVEADTTVYYSTDRITINTLTAPGDFLEAQFDGPMRVYSDKIIQVIQYTQSGGQGVTPRDTAPAAIFIPPVEQMRNMVIFPIPGPSTGGNSFDK